MKKLLSAGILGLAFLAGRGAWADTSTIFAYPSVPVQPVTAVAESFGSTDPVCGVSISNSAATSIIISTTSGFRNVSVQNLDTTAHIFCSSNAQVSATPGTSVGFKVFPGQIVFFAIVPYTNFYCINDSSGAVWAAVMRGR